MRFEEGIYGPFVQSTAVAAQLDLALQEAGLLDTSVADLAMLQPGSETRIENIPSSLDIYAFTREADPEEYIFTVNVGVECQRLRPSCMCLSCLCLMTSCIRTSYCSMVQAYHSRFCADLKVMSCSIAQQSGTSAKRGLTGTLGK